VLLVGMGAALPTHVRLDEGALERRRQIAQAMEAVPYFVGDWVGRDETVPPEAQKLLRPNGILSRTYQKPMGPRLHLLLVHCADARDMIGHYPPVCYPSSGWVAEAPAGAPEGMLRAGAVEIPVRLYGFRRMHERGRMDRIAIFNAFILPGGNVSRDISDINRQSERRAISAQGVAQVQIIAPAALGREEAAACAGELLGGLSGLWEALRVGQGGGRDS
jgi:hypothetical protein